MKSHLVIVLTLFVCIVPEAKAAQAESPIRNVLLIVSDDLKAGVLGCYGDPMCKTPNIDALAKRGMVFERAYCQGTSCSPSRISFMHSRYKDSKGVNLGEHLQAHGRYAARVGKIYHMRVPGDIIAGGNGGDIASTWTQRFNSAGQEAHTAGDYACLNQNIFTDALENRQSTAMPHRMFVTVQYDGDGSDQPDHKSATKAMELLQQHQDEPFFLAVGFVRPHYPMVAPRSYFQQHPWDHVSLPEVPPGDVDDIPKSGRGQTSSLTNPIGKYPDNQKRMWEGYYASTSFMDAQVGRVLNELDRLGLRESTAVVFTSDHGYHLGEHTFWQKVDLHENVVRVPLIVSAPGYSPGRSKSLVELVDVFPTVVDLCGLPIPESVQGTSLKPVLSDPSVVVKPGALSFTRGVGFRTENFAYMRYPDGSQEVYDMVEDGKQITNLAMMPQHAELTQRLGQELDGRLKQVKLPLPVAGGKARKNKKK